MDKYSKIGRLADVVALISLLATDKHTFRKLENIESSIRSKPTSQETWDGVAKEHPEFFRFNANKNHIALLIRSYFEENEEGNRPALTVDETQTLISTAIALYDKELLFKQRRAYLIPLYCAIVAAFVSLIGLYITQSSLSNTIKKIEVLSQYQSKLLKKTDTLIHKK